MTFTFSIIVKLISMIIVLYRVTYNKLFNDLLYVFFFNLYKIVLILIINIGLYRSKNLY